MEVAELPRLVAGKSTGLHGSYCCERLPDGRLLGAAHRKFHADAFGPGRLVILHWSRRAAD